MFSLTVSEKMSLYLCLLRREIASSLENCSLSSGKMEEELKTETETKIRKMNHRENPIRAHKVLVTDRLSKAPPDIK